MAAWSIFKVKQPVSDRQPDKNSLLPWAQKEVHPLLQQLRRLLNWAMDFLGFVRVDATDTPGSLVDKLVVTGPGLTATVTGVEGDRKLMLAANIAGADPLFNIVAAVGVVPGNPVFVNSSGQLGLSRSTTFNTCKVIGLAAATTSTGFVCPVNAASLTMTDWTSVVGSASLSRGDQYFLGATAGTMTTTAPTAVAATVVYIGKAVSTTTMELNISFPILL